MSDPTPDTDTDAGRRRCHQLRHDIAGRWAVLSGGLAALWLGIVLVQSVTEDPWFALRPRIMLIGVIPGCCFAASTGSAIAVWCAREPATSRRHAWWQFATFAAAIAIYLLSAAVYD